MRCNHKNLLRINFIAQSRDQLEVKQELRLVAKEKKQAPPSSDLQSKSKTEAQFFLLVRRKGFEPLTAPKLLLLAVFFFEKKTCIISKISSPLKISRFSGNPTTKGQGLIK